MKILLKNKEIDKELITPKRLKNIEDIIKYFTNIFDKKAIINNINLEQNSQLILEVENEENITYYLVFNNPSELDFLYGKCNIVLYCDDYHKEHYVIYFNKTAGFKEYDEYINGDVVLHKYPSVGSNSRFNTTYTIFRNDKEFKVITSNDDKWLFHTLISMDYDNVITLYNTLKKKSEAYVQDLLIEYTNRDSEVHEKIIFNRSNLSNYEKTYINEDGIKVTVVSSGEQISIKTEQKFDINDTLVTKEISVSEELIKAKRLFKQMQ